jgi:hypothetical protein
LKNFLLLLTLFFFFSFRALTQEVSIRIVADTKSENDSLVATANDFIVELRKATSFQFYIDNNGRTKNQYEIVFILRRYADENGVQYPKALRSFNPEGYYIRSSANRVDFIGNTALALQQASFDYLEQLGFRYYLPGEIWNIIPSLSSPFISYEKLIQPLFEFRSLANGQGYYRNKKVETDFNSWAKANRLGGSFPIRVGHSYQTIVSNNAEVFKKHPEYFADKIDHTTSPSAAKFNVANKQLVDLVINDAIKRLSVFDKTGQFMNMISMEPSDGGGFCTSPECLKIGSPSDQVFYLTNAVAKAIQKEYPGIWVGNLAYNEHIEPTKYDLEPNIFVMVTNGFNRTKYSTNELLQKWSKKAKKTGIYEYLSVYAWDNDLPGRSNATNLEFLKKSIQGYYENGARVYLAETNIGWISKGLGQYVASKLLWDYRLDTDSIANDFYKRSFGKAAGVIKKLYQSWQSNSGGLISDNALAEWLNLVNEADQMVNDGRIKQRLNQIKIYLHYLVLYKRLKTNPTTDNLNKVMGFAYQTFDASAFATVPVMTSLPFHSGFKGYGIYDKKEHPWMKKANQLNEKEINSVFKDDLLSVKKIEGLKSFEYGRKFKKPQKLPLSQKMKPGNLAPSFTGETHFLVRIEKSSADNFVEIKSGWAARPADAKPVTIKIYKYFQYQALKNEADIIFSAEQSEKLTSKKISLETLEAGDYLLRVEDQFKMFSLKFSQAISFSVIMSAEKMLLTSSVTGLNTFYFSVSPGTKRFIIHKSKVLKLMSPSGRLLEYTANKQESIVVEVKENETGLWQIFAQAGGLHIEGVPPYLGVVPDKILLPSELIEQ